MTLRDNLLPLIYNVRSIPGSMGLRPYTVAILLGTWSGAYTGRGSSVAELLTITEGNGQPPKVRELNTEELALGSLGKGSISIGPITPGFPGGGTPLGNLKPCVNAGQTVHVVLTGPEYPKGAKFLIKDVKTDRALHYTLTCEPVAEMGP